MVIDRLMLSAITRIQQPLGSKAVIGTALACLAIWGIILDASGNCDAAVVYPKGPDAGRQLVGTRVVSTIHADAHFLGGFSAAELSIAQPCESYYVGLTNLASGHLLSAAVPGGWLYPLLHGSDVVGAAECKIDKKNGMLRCDALYQTDFSRETREALRIAESLPQVIKQDYEARRLDIPAVSFVAVWLHGKSDDIFIPLPSTYGRLDAYQPCSESQIIAALTTEAQRDKVMWEKLDKQKRREDAVYSQAMMDYEKAHGGKCGSIIVSGLSAPIEDLEPRVVICKIQGSSTDCGYLDYRARIIYEDDSRRVVKKVEITEKVARDAWPNENR
jgi:hypothetical protein